MIGKWIFDISILKIDNKSKEEINSIGFVSLKKDKLKLSFTKRNGKFLGKLYNFTWDLVIINLSNEIFEYEEIEKKYIIQRK